MGINDSYSPDRLSGISAFVAAVDAGSFAGAAERLHLTRSAVAKRIARLESRLAVRLFHRTTRSQHLTDEGQTFYQRCTKVLTELSEAEAELSAGTQSPMGKLRVTMPVQIGRQCIAPVLLALAKTHPQLRLEMAFSDRRIDLIEEGYDLAVRSGRLDDTPGLKARSLGEQTMILCASPAYLAEHGTPNLPAELADHERLMYGRGSNVYEWPTFVPDATTQTVSADTRTPANSGTHGFPGGRTPRFVLDDLVALVTAAEQGLGIVCLPSWIAALPLRTGTLVRLMPHTRSAGTPLHLVWPDTRHPSPKLRAAIDALVQAAPELLGHPGTDMSLTDA
ncbi:HTH-type transcriptional regulator DmlR [Pandoraea pneumonica]|uniref:HTH-type transcriptional regulator DmlR n=1 Tax=Pandoraea pneumonica TaxID=2508299 RepID=A0A5E4Y6I0_9BURK|nr:LysR family transcriptional regulator [Pandoraea pneumonica]VVE43935.1 HTH-type transcriptional regulator DmlR [Pandoraea pneumonica]